MAQIYSKSGEVLIVPHKKKCRQGMSKRTKLSPTSSRPRQKRYRGQGRS